MGVYSLKRGQSGKILSVAVGGAAEERLKALGVVAGATVKNLGFSLFSGGVLLAVGGVRVGVRRSVAERIEVAPL